MNFCFFYFTLLVLFFNSLATAVADDADSVATTPQSQQMQQPPIMPLMLREAMVSLHDNSFSILSRLMEANYAVLAGLDNMTVFALDDATILSGSPEYVNSVGFHTVPNHFLTMAELERLPLGTKLPTMERGQTLVITTAGSGALRINNVRVKVPYVIRNLKIVVHSIYLAFPTIHP